MEFTVGLSLPGDLPALPEIETGAAALFSTHPATSNLALGEEPTRDFQAAHDASLLWVARAGAMPVGFALVEPLGGAWHLEEMDVAPAYARRGIGAALVRAVCEAAALRGPNVVTLCTFRDVPWNAPFYARLGFEEIPAHGLSSALQARIAEEDARGLPAERRVAMQFVSH